MDYMDIIVTISIIIATYYLILYIHEKFEIIMSENNSKKIRKYTIQKVVERGHTTYLLYENETFLGQVNNLQQVTGYLKERYPNDVFVLRTE